MIVKIEALAGAVLGFGTVCEKYEWAWECVEIREYGD